MRSETVTITLPAPRAAVFEYLARQSLMRECEHIRRRFTEE